MQIKERNRKIYENQGIVKSYANLNELQKPEQKIFNFLRDDLPNMKLLDIGIGAGRTTEHLANNVKEYLGVDYSEKMIEACRQRFPQAGEHISFQVLDARDMKDIPSNYFDVVLFSFNGIDGLSHEDRLKAFEEINRVGKKDGYFIFSTHNLQSIKKRYAINFKKNPLNIAYQMGSSVLLYLINGTPKKVMNNPYVVINDGVHHFQTMHYYIKPKEQVKQLESLGFEVLNYYSKETGKELKYDELDETKDSWVYFLCKI